MSAEPHPTQIVILAAGKGKRIGATEIPKVLLPLADKPIIVYLLEELRKLDLKNPIIVVGHQHERIRQALGKDYSYVLQEQQLGTAHAVAAALPHVTMDNVLVLNGDMPFISAQSVSRLIDHHSQNGTAMSLFTSVISHFEAEFEPLADFGRIIRDDSGKLLQIREVKDATPDQKAINEVSPGIYVFRTSWICDNIEKIGQVNARGEFYLTDTVEMAITQGHTIPSLFIAPEEVIGINTPEQLKHAQNMIERRKKQSNH